MRAGGQTAASGGVDPRRDEPGGLRKRGPDMKLDKDFLTKQLFWVLLGVEALVLTGIVVIAGFVIPAETRKRRDAVEKQWNPLKKPNPQELKNDDWVRLAKQEAEAKKKQESEAGAH